MGEKNKTTRIRGDTSGDGGNGFMEYCLGNGNEETLRSGVKQDGSRRNIAQK